MRLLREVERFDVETPPDRPVDLPAPTTDNLLITGDAMHVLDSLAKIPEYAENYLGMVKLVYIDPPFNTGQAFTNYDDNIEHSIWLTMLRDRLRQLQPLLAPDASVWVHLDDVEVHRCRLVMDEELGIENFVAEVVWQKADSPRSDAKGLSIDQDTILVYQASAAWTPNRLPRTAATNARFSSPDGDPEPWFDDNPTAPGAATHQGMVYAIQHPITGELHYPARGRCWWTEQPQVVAEMSQYADYELRDICDEERRAELCGVPRSEIRRDVRAVMLAQPLGIAAERARARYAEGTWPRIILRSGGEGGLGRKSYVPSTGLVSGTWWSNELVGHNREAKSEIKALFPGEHPFATPKPERLLSRILEIATLPGDIVLDFYAGSGTTAAVAHKMGRRWITSELIPQTVETYTEPRLRKAVEGDDEGGVTSVTERVVADDTVLPDKVSAKDAQAFNTTLTRVIGDGDVELTVDMSKQLASLARAAKKAGDGPLDDDETKTLLSLLKKFGDAGQVDVTKQAKSQLARATRTRDQVTRLWHGGGGFTHLEVGPSMFTEVGGMVLLADWATQGALTEAMCAQLSVRYEPDGVFAGRSGRLRIAVVDGMVGAGTIDAITDQLLDGENVEIWATQIADGAKQHLKDVRPRSRLQRIPAAVVDSYRRKKAARSPFAGKTTEEGAQNDG
ncbi:DNA methylase [Serinicoccus sp. CNJ-927]|nr:DNA methylase [Serinicoccus sp. CNJ-927]